MERVLIDQAILISNEKHIIPGSSARDFHFQGAANRIDGVTRWRHISATA
jgi:hypothetical protein